MRFLCGILIHLVFHLNSFVISQDTYYVLPNKSVNCPSSNPLKCHTLEQYTQSVFVSNSTFNFLPGNHTLSSVLSLSGLDSLTFFGDKQEPSIINCDINASSAGLVIMNSSSLKLTDIAFVGCHIEMEWEQLMLNKYASTFLDFSLPLTVGIYLNYVFNTDIFNVQVNGSKGYGLFGVNLLGDMKIDNVRFHENNYKTLNDPICYENVSLKCKGGNLMLVYTDLLYCPINQLRYSLTISNSSFTKGIDSGISYVPFNNRIYRNDLQFIAGAGIGLHMMQSSYGVDALITNTTIDGNAAYVGANLYLGMWDFVDNSTVTVKNSTMNYGIHPISNPLIIGELFDLAKGIYYFYGLQPFGSYTPVCQATRKYEVTIWTMEDCDVSYNNATLDSAAYMQLWPRTFLDYPREIIFERVKFQRNNGDATLVVFGRGIETLAFKMSLIECSFSKNYFENIGNSVVRSTAHQAVYQTSMLNMEYINCTWEDNEVTAFHAIESIITFSGENRFMNNTGINGAGLLLEEGSEMVLRPSSRTFFIGNNATGGYGGGIYAVMLSYKCFFQFRTDLDLPNLYFSDNYAVSAGEAVYAGNIRDCALDGSTYTEDSYEMFLNISQFSINPDSNTSVISSRANRLCLCEVNPLCSSLSTSYHNISTYPGKIFNVNIQAFGFFGDRIITGQTPAEICATIVNNNSSSGVDIVSGKMQQISQFCSSAAFVVQGYEGQTVDIVLSPVTSTVFYPVYIRVVLQNCPIGFSFSNQSRTCECASIFSSNGVICNIGFSTFTRKTNQWIGLINGNDDVAAVAGDCIESEHCNNSEVSNFTLAESDVQCINDHSGVLCGGCRYGYSVILGSTECRECSNSYLALLSFFAVAGLFWIVFLSFFDVTVKSGRVNGMLFYANVIKLANFEFFALRQPAYLAFQIMINWVNLDFGIPSCFYDGFDLYVKTWLNFAFPLYLFLHFVVIVFCAKRFGAFNKILPTNILAVLTTLALLCFTKLLRSCSFVWPFQKLESVGGSDNVVVWLFDGNISYFSLKHGILFVFSSIVFVVFVLPFAVVLVINPYLQSFTAHEDTCFERFVCFFRRKIFKFKPLLETYDGPYLTKHRYYNGLLIILRLAIFLITVSTSYNSNGQVWFKSTAVSIICIILLGVVVKGKIYGCPANVIVEFLYLVNLTILEFVILVMQLSGVSNENQGIVVSLSIAGAFVTFVGVVIYEKSYMCEPKLYKLLGKDYVSREDACGDIRQKEGINSQTIYNINDSDNQFLSVIDEERRMNAFAVTKQEQLIQDLITSEN